MKFKAFPLISKGQGYCTVNKQNNKVNVSGYQSLHKVEVSVCLCMIRQAESEKKAFLSSL